MPVLYAQCSSAAAAAAAANSTVTATLEHIYSADGMRGPFLIVVPLSTLEHWRREIEAWTDMQLCVYHDIGGGKDMRDVIREYECALKSSYTCLQQCSSTATVHTILTFYCHDYHCSALLYSHTQAL
eukprot:20495-Heterococcus_DN1.PRE.2